MSNDEAKQRAKNYMSLKGALEPKKIMDTLCKGNNCPMKEQCKRYTSPADATNQWYFTESPIKDGKCDMFWGDKADEIMEQLKSIMQVEKK